MTIDVLKELDKRKEELSSKKLSADAKRKLDKKFRLELSFHSNHLEGNTLTYGETQMLLFFGKAMGDHEKREFDEMEAHDVAVKMIENWAIDQSRNIIEADIRQLNKLILVRPFWKEAITPEGQSTRKEIIPGEYKSAPNSVRLKNGEIHEYASPSETPILMNQLMEKYSRDSQHPVIRAAWFHHQFTAIHPFDDGNGRVARLLTNYILIRNGYPPIVIKTEKKEEYLTALQLADSGNLEPFVVFLANQLQWSLDLSLKAVRGESIDEPGDLDKRIELLKRQLDQKDIVTKQRSTDSIYHVIKDSIFPLFESFEKSVEKLKDLFIDYERRITASEASGVQVQVGDRTSRWDQLTANWLEGNVVGHHKIINRIDYHFELKGFKKSVTQQYMSVNLVIQFSEFSYSIEINSVNRNITYHSYDAGLNETQLNSLVTIMVDYLIYQISAAGGIKDKV